MLSQRICLAQSRHFLYNFSFFSDNFFELSENGSENTLKCQRLMRGETGEKLCEKMGLFCSFSSFVMGKLFLRKVKFYLRNVTDR